MNPNQREFSSIPPFERVLLIYTTKLVNDMWGLVLHVSLKQVDGIEGSAPQMMVHVKIFPKTNMARIHPV